jgi:hypothetical protein
VFDAYLSHCEARLTKLDLAYATVASYRRVIDSIWRHNPARGLKTLRIRRKDRPSVDPFSIEEAETLIAAIHQDWGEAHGNYDEFRFFTGLRPSEQIALLVSDCDLVKGTIAVTKARVMARDKDRTKTSEDRTVALCPRAVDVLKRQLALRERWQRLGTRMDHEHVFFKDDGEPIHHLHYGWRRWRHSLERLNPAATCAIQGAPLLHHLESDDRRESALGRQAARPQRALDAGRLCELAGRHGRTRDRPDRTGDAALTDDLAPAWHQCRASDTTAGENTEMCGGERGIRIQRLSRINKLLILKATRSPPIPGNPRSCH